MSYKKVYKTDDSDSWCSGVVGGICRAYNINPFIPRILFLISVFTFGFPLLVYIALAFFMPNEDEIPQSER